MLTVNGATELIGRSFPQANEAIARLAEAGVLSQVTVGRRNRAYEAKDIVNAFTDLERQLASPGSEAPQIAEQARALLAGQATRRRPPPAVSLSSSVIE